MEIISRKEAKEQGLKFYFTGQPCVRGHINKRYASGKCVSCSEEDRKKWREDNRERANELRRNAYWRDPQKGRDSVKKYRAEDPARTKEQYKKWYWEDPEKRRQSRRDHYRQNREKIRAIENARNKECRAARLEAERRYIEKNRDKVRERKREYNRRKYKTDKRHKAILFMRRQLADFLAGKKGRTEDLLGYTRDDLVQHMESLFHDGMSWDNHGEWHIDHITPISHFLKEGKDAPHVVHALENLQPLWAFDNLSKGAKLLD